MPAAPRAVAAGLCLAALALLVWLPIWAEGRTPGALGMAVLVALLVLAARMVPARFVWAPASAAVAMLAAAALLFPVATLLRAAAGSAAKSAVPMWDATPTFPVAPALLVGSPQPWTLPVLLAAVGLAAAAVRAARGWALGTGPVLGAFGVGVLPLLYAAPLWVAVALPAAIGAALAMAAALWSRAAVSAGGAAVGLAGIGWTLVLPVGGAPALASTELTAALASAASALAGATALVTRWPRGAHAFFAVASAVLGGVAVFGWATTFGVSGPSRAFVLVAAGAIAFVAAQLGIGRRQPALRLGAEIGAGLVGGAGLLLIAGGPWLGWLALALTVAGTAVVATALLASDRRALSAPGGLLLAAASWVRLSDLGVGVVEAYTLPTALALTAAGVWRLQRNPSVDTIPSLLPGLALAVGPSVLLCLDDPVSLRGLLLGFAALGLVLTGAALWWSAPLVVGAITLAVLALRQLAPLAVAVPRWSLLAVAGLVLFAVGVTWEQRRRDLAVAAKYVTSLR